MEKKTRLHVWYAVAALFLVLTFQSWWSTYTKVEPIPYSRFEQLLDQGKIAEVAVQQNYIQGRVKEPLEGGRQYFVTTRVDPDIAERLSKAGVTYSGVIESTWLRDLLSWVLPVLLLFGLPRPKPCPPFL